MTAYNNIPLSVRESDKLQQLRNQAPSWPPIRLLKMYMKSLKEKNNPCLSEPEQFSELAEYYLFRKELLRRMSPLLGRRSSSFLDRDNKHLLSMLEYMVEKKMACQSAKMKNLILEICRRMS